MTVEDFEIIPAALVIRRSRAAWEAEQMDALRERRARRQPITDAEVSAWQERRGESLLPAINARAAEVRARWPKPSGALLSYAPSATPEPQLPAWLADPTPERARPSAAIPRTEPPPQQPSEAQRAAGRRAVAKMRERRADQQKAEREERQRRAIELLNVGADTERIAAELEITEYTVRRLLRQAGVQPPAVAPPRPPQASAVPPTPSATPPAVAPPAPKASAPPKPARPSAQEARLAQAEQRRQQIAALVIEGKTDGEIATLLKVSSSLVGKRRLEAGLAENVKPRGASKGRAAAKSASRQAAAAPINTDLGIPALVQRRVRSLAAEGVPAHILAKVYKLKRADIEALLGADAAEEVAS